MTCSNEIFEPVQMMEFYAEGYTGAVVDVLARQWSDLAQLQKLISHDEAFRIFVYRTLTVLNRKGSCRSCCIMLRTSVL